MAGKEITDHLPDVDDADIHKVRYTGAGAALRATIKAKEQMRNFRSRAAAATGTRASPTPRRDPLASVSFNTGGNEGATGAAMATRSAGDGRQDASAPPLEEEPGGGGGGGDDGGATGLLTRHR